MAKTDKHTSLQLIQYYKKSFIVQGGLLALLWTEPAVTHTLAYDTTKFITSTKSFIVHSPRFFAILMNNKFIL